MELYEWEHPEAGHCAVVISADITEDVDESRYAYLGWAGGSPEADEILRLREIADEERCRSVAQDVAAERERCARVIRDLMGAMRDHGAATNAGLAYAHGLTEQALHLVLHGFEEPHEGTSSPSTMSSTT